MLSPIFIIKNFLNISSGYCGIIFLSLFIGTLAFAGESENKRIDELEKEIHDLKTVVNELSEPRVLRPQRDSDIPSLKIRGFADFQYDAKEDGNNFTLGDMDLFITSRVSRKLKFLSETVFEFDKNSATQVDESEVDIERLLLKYEYADWLNISMGRGHTALGYWNHTFHHGKWLQTTTDRPILFKFEDRGGILPVHFVGLELAGLLQFDFGTFSYISNVANGRARTPDEVQLLQDDNGSKQVSFMFTLEPNRAPGLGIGASILVDRIPNNPAVGRINGTQELIAGFHFFYIDDRTEFLVEFQAIEHDSLVDHSHNGGYLQFAYNFGKIKPYYRFDFLNIDSNDTFFSSKEDIDQHTAGIRYDWYPFAALKLEYRYSDSDSFNSNAGTIQISFAF